MPTGKKYTNFNSKMVVSLEALAAGMLNYLRDASKEAVLARWDVDGVFNTKLTLAGTGTNDEITATGSNKGTDGNGHILTFADATVKVAKFPNVAATPYYVGAAYCAIPEGILINPRTGKPFYKQYRDDIGDQAAPDFVTDNGDGTITFLIDGVTEAGQDQSGRTVLVWMVTPDDNALTADVAIETCTSVYSGGANIITTVGTLGQTVVNTLQSKYQVAVLGPRVTRGIDLRTTLHMFLGMVTGNGPGAVPVTFDTTDQKLLKTFDDASQILFTPHNFLTATDVQVAIEQLVDALTSQAAPVGGSYVGMYADDWHVRNWGIAAAAGGGSNGGGFGNFTDDGAFPALATNLMSVLLKVETAVRKRRAWSATHARAVDTNDRNIADWTGYRLDLEQGGTYVKGGSFWLQAVANHANDAQGFEIQNAAWDGVPYFLGEEAGFNPQDYIPITKAAAAGSIEDYGRWERVYFRGDGSAPVITGGANGHNFSAVDFAFKATYLRLSDTNVGGRPFYLHNGISVAETGETVGAWTSTLPVISGPYDGYFHGVVENCLFSHPPSTQTSPAVPAAILSLATNAAAYPQMGPFVFRNCVFICTYDAPAVLMSSFAHKVVFENCHFFSQAAMTATLFQASGSNVELRNCVFYAHTGLAVALEAMKGCMVDCVIMGGSDGTVTAPQAFTVTGAGSEAFEVRNLRILLGAGNIRATGTAGKPAVEIGSANDGALTTAQALSVDGLWVEQYAGSNIHRAETVLLWGSHADDRSNVYKNINVDLGGASPAENGHKNAAFTQFPVVGVVSENSSSRVRVFGLAVRNMTHPSANYTGKSLIVTKGAEIHGLFAYMPTTGTSQIGSLIELEGYTHVHGGQVHSDGLRALYGFVHFKGVNNRVRGVDSINPVLTGAGGAGTTGYIRFDTDGDNLFDGGNWTGVDLSAYTWGFINSKESKVKNNHVSKTGTCNSAVVTSGTTGKRAQICHNEFVWEPDGAQSAIIITGDDSLVTDNTCLRTTGSAAAVSDGSVGSVTTQNILSTAA